jgi:hypothetical protein
MHGHTDDKYLANFCKMNHFRKNALEFAFLLYKYRVSFYFLPEVCEAVSFLKLFLSCSN